MSFFTAEDVLLDQFYQIPKALVQNEEYKDLTPRAVIAYGILRDRHSVSVKNQWIDDQGRIYFKFSDKDLGEILDTSPKTANKIKNALQEHDLIHMERVGLNQVNRIYLLKPNASDSTDRKKSSNPEEKKSSNPEGKKTSNQDEKKTSPKSNTNLSNTNLSNTNLSNTNLSINESIESLELSEVVKKSLKDNTDRLIRDSINLDDVTLVHGANLDRLNDYQFAYVVGCVLEHTKKTIVSMKHVLQRSIDRYIEQHHEEKPSQPKKAQQEVLPSWYKSPEERKEERQEQEETEEVYDPTDIQERIARLREGGEQA